MQVVECRPLSYHWLIMSCVNDFFDDPEQLGLEVAPDSDGARRRPYPTAAEAVARLEARWDAVQAAKAAVPEPRWWRRREAARAFEARRAADREFQSAFAGIARASVGAVPGEWGLLSDNLESTLDHYLERDIGEELRERLTAIRSKVFEARLLAHTGDRSLETTLSQDVASCLDLEPSDEHARRLVHHLPTWARPIPDVDMAAVAHTLASRGSAGFAKRYFDYMDQPWTGSKPRFPLATFTVTFDAIDTLELHDIIVARDPDPDNDNRRSPSAGLGSAALTHLCRTADHYGLSIFGKIMPGDRTEESAARLAGWYGRHGFDIEPRTPGVFLWATVRRAPRVAREERG
jgi:hypothetical protein